MLAGIVFPYDSFVQLSHSTLLVNIAASVTNLEGGVQDRLFVPWCTA